MCYGTLVNDFAAKIFSSGILVAGATLSFTYTRMSKAHPLQGRDYSHVQLLIHKNTRMSYLKFSNRMIIFFNNFK